MLEGKWTCRKCRNQNEDFFELCILCGHDRDGKLPKEREAETSLPAMLDYIARLSESKRKRIMNSNSHQQYRIGYEDGMTYVLNALEAHINKVDGK